MAGGTNLWLARVAASTVLGLLPLAAMAAYTSGDAAVDAVKAGDCAAAGRFANLGMDENDPAAFRTAGYLYEATGCVQVDPARAAKYYQRGAELGDAPSARYLGVLYGLGKGVPQDFVLADKWYRYPDDKGASPADANYSPVVSGYAHTVIEVATGGVKHPEVAKLAGVNGSVRVEFDAATGTTRLLQRSSVIPVGSNIGSTARFVDSVQTAFKDAVAVVPKPVIPANVNTQFVATIRFEDGRGDARIVARNPDDR